MVRLSTEERKEQIARTVLGIIAEGGIASLSMPQVAKECGIVQSALYRHYDGKEDMIIAAVSLLVKQIRDMLTESWENSEHSLDTFKSMLAFLRGAVGLATVFPRVIFSLKGDDAPENLRKFAHKNITSIISLLASILRDGQEKKELRSDFDPEAGALMYWGILVTSTLKYHVTQGTFDLENYHKHAWQLFERAVLPDKRKGRKK